MNTFKKILYVSLLVLAANKSQAQVNKSNTINITKFTADEKENKLFVDWATDGSVPTNYFEVQKSDDGATFRTVAVVLGPDPGKTGDSYEYAEAVNNKAKKAIYFRLRHVSVNGDEQLTKIIQL